MANVFDRLDELAAQQGSQAVLDALVEHLRQAERHHELFEALKLQIRQRLGLPLLANDLGEQLPASQREALESGLLEACREVGLSLWQAGQLRDGWHYLRALADRPFVQRELAKIKPEESNVDQFLELGIHEGLDLQRGFQTLLDHYGTCNSITTFDSAMYGRPRADRAIGAALLVEHVYKELGENLAAHLERREASRPDNQPLSVLIEGRDWLFENGTYHLDTTHLAAVVRFARDLEDPRSLALARELSEYGKRLDPELQYPGDEPFEDLYETSCRYFDALLGNDASSHLAFFRQRAEQSDPHRNTTIAIEVYVDLLDRVGQSDVALAEALRLLPEGIQQTGRAPALLELAARSGDFEPLRELSRRRQDPLGYALSLLQGRTTDAGDRAKPTA